MSKNGISLKTQGCYNNFSLSGKMTRSLRISLVAGLLWLFICLANSAFYFLAFGVNEGSKVGDNRILMYSMIALIVFSALFANCVYVAVILR